MGYIERFFEGVNAREASIRAFIRSIGYEILHEFFIRRGPGKFYDEFGVDAVAGGAIGNVVQIQLAGGEGVQLERFGYRITAGVAGTTVVSLTVNQKAIRGYAAMVGNLLNPTSLEWDHLTEIDHFCNPGSVIALMVNNGGVGAVTVEYRVRGRIVPMTFGPSKRP